MRNSRWNLGSVQSKVISLLTLALITLSPIQPAFAAFGGGSPTVPNPSAFTADTEAPKIDGSTGAFAQSVPIDIPPGRNGLQPNVSLQYNSQNTSDGIVGYGWSLSVPYIERYNKAGSQTLYAGTSYTSSIDGELASEATTTTPSSSLSLADVTNLTVHHFVANTSVSFTYTVPSGSNQVLIVRANDSDGLQTNTFTGTQNGQTITFTKVTTCTPLVASDIWYGKLVAPTSGTFTINASKTTTADFVVYTVNGADQTNPVDAENCTSGSGASSYTASITPPSANDLLLDWQFAAAGSGSSHGGGQTEYINFDDTGVSDYLYSSYIAGSSAASTSQQMTERWTAFRSVDFDILAIKPAASATTTPPTSFRARVDDGSHNSYSFNTIKNTWTVYDKKGTKYTYGSTDAGRMYDTTTGTSTNTYRWMLQEVRDTNDNYITYTYNRDSNVLYPYKITYTGHGNTDGIDSVTFATSTRSDTRLSYASGFAATTTKIISGITAAVNGTTVRQYDLTYGVGDNGYRSLLASVQEKGYDDNNNLTTLPAMTFAYATSSTQFYKPAAETVMNAGYVVADTEGDGINDVNAFTSAPDYGYVFSDNAAGASSLAALGTRSPDYWSTIDIHALFSPVERGVRYIDVNGDGKADVVRGWVNDQAQNSDFAIYTNQYSTSTGAYSWSATSTNYSGSIPTFAKITSAGLILTGGLFGDVNGDGLPDYVTSLPGTLATTTYLGNGSAWDATTTVFAAAKSFPTATSTETASQLVDVNGDGLDDWVYSIGNNMYVLLNTGTGWSTSPDPHWTFATSTLYLSGGTYYDRGIRFMDLNGDGLPDLVRSYQNTGGCSGAEVADVKAVYLNTGSGWATSTAYTLPAYITSCIAGALVSNEYVNFNGNGQQQQDVLSSVTNPKGGGLAVSYKMAGNAGSVIRVLAASTTVASDGRGTYATTSYAYSGGFWYSNVVRDRRFAGFSPVTVTSPDSIVATYFGQGSLAQIGRPLRKEVSDLSSNLKQRTLYRWDTVAHGDGTFIGLGRQVIEDFAADGSHRDKAIDYSYSPTTDDLLNITQYGEVTSNSDTTFTDVTGDTRTTNMSYAASSSVNLSMPIEKTILNNSSATSSDQKFYYDSLAFGSVGLGNNTRQEDWVSGTTYASSTNTYNSYGLVATTTDRGGHATSYVYDAYNLFPATTTNALLQKTQFYYNYANGKVRKSTDPNSRLTLNLFDGLGRLKETAQSSTTTPTTYATSTTYTYTDSTTTPSLVHRSDYLSAASTVDTYDYYDGLNRLIQERKQSQTANVYGVFDRVFNQVNELASTSLPYFSSGSSFTNPTTVSNLYTNYFYDPLQRVTKISNAVGTSTNTYYRWTTTTTDPNGHLKDSVVDAFGNLTNVVEHRTDGVGTTTYAYDALNNLATTTDALGNVRAFAYDGLSRRTSAQDLHAVGDATFGTWTYTYDDAGNTTSQTDPKSQVINRTYDALNRMLTEDYTGQAGTEVTNTYDSCTNGIGYLCTASSTSANTTNTYDILGRISISTTTVQNIGYATTYAYDRQGNVTGLTYPNGSQVNYTFNLAGLPNRVQRKASGGSFSDIVSNFDYAPQGQIQNTLFGNNASTTYFYDANSMYRLSNLQTNSGGTSIQNFAYTYDAVGNITQIANTASSTAKATIIYSYDALNRLLIANGTNASSSPYAQFFAYDALGNPTAATTTQYSAGVTASWPTLADTPNLTLHFIHAGTSNSFTYTVPSGTSQELLIMIHDGSDNITPSGTQNGSAITFKKSVCSGNANVNEWFGYLQNPSTGTNSLSLGGTATVDYYVMTLNGVTHASSSPIDNNGITCKGTSSVSSQSTSFTPDGANDLLISLLGTGNPALSSHGAGQTEYAKDDDSALANYVAGSYVQGASTVSTTQSMSENWTTNQTLIMNMLAIKPVGAALGTTTANTYTYAGTGYANPHALTTLSNGVSTSTFVYDNDGNVTQKTTDGTTTTYIWDYANRLTALGVGGATTTYAYDYAGNRVLQTGTSTTWIYPSRFYSIASSTGSGAKFSTTTELVFNGDTLLSTIDQQFVSGNATGSPQTQYIHPDHLGSTNVITNASGTVVTAKDYYPYGSVRVNSGSASLARGYIGQFADQSNLSYLNARYYDSSRGQFLSQDPIFWGNPKNQNLQNPQSLNSYSYANDNPITNEDPSGLLTQAQNSALISITAQLQGILGALNVIAASGGGISSGTAGAIQQSIKSASAAVSTIAAGGNATLSPANTWAPSTSGSVTGYTPFTSGSGVTGVGSQQENRILGNMVLLGLSFTPQGRAGEVLVEFAGELVPVFRGGSEFIAGANELSIKDGLVQPGKGVSVNINPAKVTKFGTPTQVSSLPGGLQLVPRGSVGHFEIAPSRPMPMGEYQSLLNRINVSGQ